VENKSAISLVVSLDKALKEMRLPLTMVRQVVTDRSGDAAQLVERRDSNRNLRNLGSTTDAVTRRVSLRNTRNAILGPLQSTRRDGPA